MVSSGTSRGTGAGLLGGGAPVGEGWGRVVGLRRMAGVMRQCEAGAAGGGGRAQLVVGMACLLAVSGHTRTGDRC